MDCPGQKTGHCHDAVAPSEGLNAMAGELLRAASIYGCVCRSPYATRNFKTPYQAFRNMMPIFDGRWRPDGANWKVTP